MEVLHFFPNEIVVPRAKKLGYLYVVKAGKLRLVSDDNSIVAVYGPGMAVGLGEILEHKTLDGNLMAFRAATVLAVERDFLLAELDDAEPHVKQFFGSIGDTIGRRAVNS